ncbi:branched-chain amino acid ABC transporter permease [Haloferax larsenii]|uniref:Branched-chain amino acid ABC transporter permease n=1 Tax=Haloferax larsenii TaxID=302484 RepID=A0ABY5RFC4_HALLR|nr:branched-chain amino acid ABC transporter permease [Haloferax larsenii]UVE51067.1 branched-chain amino acid ABC transporter permease [Haloferax larsenii]
MASAGLLDALLQGLITGMIIAAGALGLSLIYSIAEVPNFAHGDMITIGAYLALALNKPGAIPFVPEFGGLPLIAAGILGVAVAGSTGAIYEVAIFRRFRSKGADLITMVIVSLGLALVLRNVVLFLVGSGNINYDTERVTNTNVELYLTGNGLSVQTVQRQAGDLVTLGEWGYGWLSLLAIVVVAAAVGVGVYRWRSDDASFETVHLVSPRVFGVASGIVALAALATVLQGAPHTIDAAVWSTSVGVSIKYGVIIGLTLVTMLAMNLLLKGTKTGRAMRATADNMALAEIRGVNIDRVQLVVWVLAALLTALAGVLTGWFASNLNPNMGFSLLLPIFAAVIMGGITSPYGAVLASLIIGVSMDVGVFLLPAEFATYRTAIAFVILIGVLLVKPEGLWGDV